MAFELKEGERLDDLQISTLKIIQSPDKFRFGMDAVLLSGFVHVKRKDRVLDLGTGTGILPLLLYAKTEASSFTGLEIQEESAEMARRSVRGNGISEKEGEGRSIRIVTGDIKEASSLFKKGSFDTITANPPYMMADHGIGNPDTPKRIARHEVLCTFSDVAGESFLLLKPGGRLFLVHRPFRLPELFSELMKHRLEPKRMRLVHPFSDREPNMVLIEAVKDGRPGIKVERPLIVYESAGVYTEEIKRDYRY